jgi:hypothetical protein
VAPWLAGCFPQFVSPPARLMQSSGGQVPPRQDRVAARSRSSPGRRLLADVRARLPAWYVDASRARRTPRSRRVREQWPDVVAWRHEEEETGAV